MCNDCAPVPQTNKEKEGISCTCGCLGAKKDQLNGASVSTPKGVQDQQGNRDDPDLN
ncbi:MAG: hypothetical protein RBG13Loki_2045 [Promethearchaeota archaeon CR_4]|nr:MAG: hypothetical protein RBG13Loki_2045 [Candidatus Lokiarchaeota archaeon CR_4]